ncbi:MAG: hypothetical protein QME66_01975 [Candidatus Eisenbacteria bacterium]|nr:hypothetical protein [Candidatus Eisenbacteria bacterium]
MTRLLWLQAALIATAGMYTAWGTWAGDSGFSLALAAAVVLPLLVFRSVVTVRIAPWVYCATGVIALVGLFVPPCRLPSVLLLAGMIAFLVARHVPRAGAAALAFSLTGLMLQAQNIALFAYAKFEARYHAWPTTRAAVTYILRLCGIHASVDTEGISIQGAERTLQVDVNPEMLGLRFFLAFMVCGLVLVFLFRRERRGQTFLYLLISGAAYMLLRFAYLTYLYPETSSLKIFSHPGWTFATFLPFVVAVARLVALDNPGDKLELGMSMGSMRPSVIPWALIVLASYSLVTALLFVDPGEKKNGRILIDEGHSDWEWTTTPMDTVSFGQGSTYNYFCLKRLLEHYYQVNTTRQDLNIDLLSRYDILIVKTPTRHYSRDEADAIEAFVRNSGGLFLISDHTDVFGMTTFINPIASRFGLEFQRDATFDLDSGKFSIFQPWMALPHPIIRDVAPLVFLTTCTIDSPLRSQDVITGRGLGTERPDYSTRNFLGDSEKRRPIKPQFGAFLQLVAVLFGRGRVVGFTDSTVFSSFCLFMPGKSELLLNTIGWLNRRNVYYWVQPVLGGVGLVMILLLFPIIWRRIATITVPGLILAVSFGLAGGWLTADVVGEISYSRVPARIPYAKVCFEVAHSPSVKSAFFAPRRPEPDGYTTFYAWVQRLDLTPAVADGLTACAGADMVVILEPTRPFGEADVEWLIRYLQEGGKVLLLDDPRNLSSTAETLLKRFGLLTTRHPARRTKLQMVGSSEQICDVNSSRTITGGDPWIVTTSGDTVAAAISVGRGKLAAMIQSSIFTQAHMGEYTANPNENQLRISRLEFWLLNKMLEAGPRDN